MQDCPLCGSNDLRLSQNKVTECAIHGSHPVGYWVECGDCDLESNIQPTFQKAITEWNSL